MAVGSDSAKPKRCSSTRSPNAGAWIGAVGGAKRLECVRFIGAFGEAAAAAVAEDFRQAQAKSGAQAHAVQTLARNVSLVCSPAGLARPRHLRQSERGCPHPRVSAADEELADVGIRAPMLKRGRPIGRKCRCSVSVD